MEEDARKLKGFKPYNILPLKTPMDTPSVLNAFDYFPEVRCIISLVNISSFVVSDIDLYVSAGYALSRMARNARCRPWSFLQYLSAIMNFLFLDLDMYWLFGGGWFNTTSDIYPRFTPVPI